MMHDRDDGRLAPQEMKSVDEQDRTAPRFEARKGLGEAEIGELVDAVLDEATLEEKVAMMSGGDFYELIRQGEWGDAPYRAGAGCERLGVPALYYTDGPRGVVRGHSTCFPVTMARGASFDVDLERRIGEIMGIETRAQGCNLSGAVCVNLLRHPAWGRAQETYGEDPYHLGEMGAALAEGLQAHNVIATVKHFACNSIENSRFKVDVRVDDRTLREVYLAHFKRILDAGCATVMSAYNKVNGEYCGQNRELLTDILRGEWGFEGFVHCDWIAGVYKTFGATAGLDIENPSARLFGAKLVDAVRSGVIDPKVVDTACRRILTTMYRFLCAEDPLDAYQVAQVACPAHRAVAREAAEKSAVLLKNAGMLPLDRSAIRTVAVLGKLADMINTGDAASSRVRAPEVITPLAGLAAALGPDVEILCADEDDLEAAGDAAARADAVIVVVGYTAADEGEYTPTEDEVQGFDDVPNWPAKEAKGGDRKSLRIAEAQVQLIRVAALANPSTVAVLVGGSAVIIEEWRALPAAILQTFYAGMEGGHALASLLLGDVAPSGRLPFTVPRDEADLPFYDCTADSIEYGPLHGYSLFDSNGKSPAFPFGYGLSYVDFNYRALRANVLAGTISVSVAVTNRGTMAADEVVQLYVGFPGRDAVRPRKLLRGFSRVSLAPGATRICRFEVPFEELKWWNPVTRDWALEHGDYEVLVGGSSCEEDLKKVTVCL